MTTSDPIADLLTRIRNGARAGKRYVEINYSSTKVNIIKVLKEQGFIDGFLSEEPCKAHPGGRVRVYLKYDESGKPVIRQLERVSKPSCRKYAPHNELPIVFGGMGTAIISTPKGIKDGRTAHRERLGGEVLALVW